MMALFSSQPDVSRHCWWCDVKIMGNRISNYRQVLKQDLVPSTIFHCSIQLELLGSSEKKKALDHQGLPIYPIITSGMEMLMARFL